MFTNATQFKITGGTFYVPGVHDDLDRLLREVASNALHNSSTRFDPPRCHPNSRRAILDSLHRWIRGLDMPDISVVWLYGPAGAGKSAIMQTLAEECAQSGLLLATFFFSMSDASRNHPHAFVATIAYQITRMIPQLQSALQTAINRDPLILKKSIDDQMQCLIVEPLKTLAESRFFDDRTTAPRLILVDGLDECTDIVLRGSLLRSIATTLTHHHIPLIFLIASRPKQDITHTFHSSPMTGLLRDSLVLNYKYNSSNLYPDSDDNHNHPLVKATICDSKKVRADGVRRKLPLRPAHLEAFVLRARSTHSYDDLLFATILSCCFYACHRSGELVQRNSKDLFDWRKVIQRDSLFFSKGRAQYRLPYHKADPFYRGTIILHNAQEVANPVALLKEYVSHRDDIHSGRLALFIREDGSHPTCSWFDSCFFSLLSREFGGDSPRAGGATFYASLGLSEDVIQAIGRWSSLAWKIYIRDNPTIRAEQLLASLRLRLHH